MDAIKLAIGLIAQFEGYAKRLNNGDCCAYPDPATGGDPFTIGYGSTGPDIKQHTIWSKEKAYERLTEHVQYFAAALLKLSPKLATASPERFAAVISWVYNLGLGNYRISTFKKRIDANDWRGAAIECRKWKWAAGRILPGLIRRREAEALMMGGAIG